MAAPTDSTHPHILLATDRAANTRAHLEFATRLGNKLGARMTLYHAIPPVSLVVNTVLGSNRADANETADQVRRALAEEASPLPADRPIDIEIEEAVDAHTAVLEAADRLHADLIVLPTHGRTGLSRAVLGSTAEKVVRECKLPVLLLTDLMLKNEQALGQGPMLIATDLSPSSVDAHLPAVTLAHRLGLPVRLLSIVTDPIPPQLSSDAPGPDPDDQHLAIEARTKRLHELALALDSDTAIEVECQVAKDPVGPILHRAEELHASLLVMTTHGRRGVLRMLQGSVAEQVVRRATTPVMVMPMAR